MNSELAFLIKRMSDDKIKKTSIIPWSAPIPSFGNLYASTIATVGLNPSNKEFIGSDGNELQGPERRFPTLNSLKLASWAHIEDFHIEQILDSCQNYFNRNPYSWFKKLDFIISGTARSFFFPFEGACHLDLIPFATSEKWGHLLPKEKSLLLDLSGDTLGMLVRASPIKSLILNGGTVVNSFKRISDVRFKMKNQENWTLPRKPGTGVFGFSYEGYVSNIGGVSLNREVQVLGYNHNIQSSFGVTTEVMQGIREWISKRVHT